MSVWAKKWAYEQRVGNSGAKAVLVALAEFADEVGFCYPSQPTLAAMTEIAERTVRGHLAYLEENNFIEREGRRGHGGKWTSDGHRLLAPPEALKPPMPKPNQRQISPPADSAAGRFRRHQRQISPPADSAAKPSIESDEPSIEPSEENSLSARAREAVDAFTSAFDHPPHIHGQTEMEAEAEHDDFDIDLWRATVRKARTNLTPAKNVGTILDMYRDALKRAAGGKGANKPEAPAAETAGEFERREIFLEDMMRAHDLTEADARERFPKLRREREEASGDGRIGDGRRLDYGKSKPNRFTERTGQSRRASGD